MNETVKYDNRLNEISLPKFTAVDLNLFMLLCARAKGKGQELLTFPYDDLKRSLGLERQSDQYFHNGLYRMCGKLSQIKCHFKNEKEFGIFILFTTFDGNLEKRTLTVRVNIDFAFLLNKISMFTRFELSEFVELESKYSKTLYRLLKQYKSTGWYEVGIDSLRTMMDAPKSYSNKTFMYECVNVAIRELNGKYFQDLNVETVRGSGRGRKILGYKFTFQPQKDEKEKESAPEWSKNQKPAKPAKTNKFNNFEGRKYTDADFEKFENLAME